MIVKVNIHLKSEVVDVQGDVIKDTLHKLKFSGINRARIGKQIILDIDVNTKERALKYTKEMCKKLLVNPITEDYTVEILS